MRAPTNPNPRLKTRTTSSNLHERMPTGRSSPRRRSSRARGLRWAWVLLASAGWACGGDVTDQQAQAGASGGGAAGGAGGGQGGSGAEAGSGAGGATASSSSAGGGPADCENAPKYIDNLLQAAAACAPEDPSLHCQDIVDGFCCPVVVESASSPATQAYLDFLELTRERCPEMWDECEVVDCGLPVPGNCQTDGAGEGHCVSRPR